MCRLLIGVRRLIGLDYEQFYDLVLQEIEFLKLADFAEDYRLCKALAACYELQDYLAERIAILTDQGILSNDQPG